MTKIPVSTRTWCKTRNITWKHERFVLELFKIENTKIDRSNVRRVIDVIERNRRCHRGTFATKEQLKVIDDVVSFYVYNILYITLYILCLYPTRVKLTCYSYCSQVAREQETHAEPLHFLNETYRLSAGQFIGVSDKENTNTYACSFAAIKHRHKTYYTPESFAFEKNYFVLRILYTFFFFFVPHICSLFSLRLNCLLH